MTENKKPLLFDRFPYRDINKLSETELGELSYKEIMIHFATLEAKANGEFPLIYKDYMAKLGGASVAPSRPLSHPLNSDMISGDSISVGVFFGVHPEASYNMRSELDNDLIDETLAPIAENGGGDSICICVRGKNKGKVFYSAHEIAAEPGGEIQYAEKIADNFEEFVNLLYLEE